MDEASFLILTYSSFNNKIEGRTKLQKLIYFLSILMKKEKELEFDAHYYGPYSPVITNVNSKLKSLRYLSELQKDTSIINNKGFEIKRYDYKLTNDGMKMADSLKKQFPNEWNEISRNAENINKAGKLDYLELAVASKVFYILSQETEGTATKEKIRNIACKFGWEVTESEVDKASKFLANLELIKLEK
jgi:uncharacterized protein YwgA